MTGEELIYNLRTNLQYAGSSLINKTDHHLMFMLDEARSIFIGRTLQNRSNLEAYSQFVDLTPVKANKAIIGTVLDQFAYYVTPPTPISLAHGVGITSVGATDGADEYGKIDFGRIKTAVYKKYTGNDPKWFYDEGRVVMINRNASALTKVRVRGFFDEPYKIEHIKNLNVNHLRPFSFTYPISNKDIAAIYAIAMSGDLSWGDAVVQTIARQQQQSNYRQQKQAPEELQNAEE